MSITNYKTMYHNKSINQTVLYRKMLAFIKVASFSPYEDRQRIQNETSH